MKVITFCNLKGGVGKSLINYNAGGFLAKQGKRVLHIDADMQANLTDNLGVNEEFDFGWKGGKQDYPTISNILLDNALPKDVIVKAPIKGIDGMDLVPSSIDLYRAEMLVSGVMANAAHTVMKTWIKRNREFLEQQYDYILFDVGPYLSVATQNALYASDEIFLIMDISKNAYKGIVQLYKQWESISSSLEVSNNMKGIIVNKYNTRQKTLSDGFKDYILDKDNLPVPVFQSFIHESAPFKKSELLVPIAFSTDRETLNSQGFISFNNLMTEIQGEGWL